MRCHPHLNSRVATGLFTVGGDVLFIEATRAWQQGFQITGSLYNVMQN
jgi:ATP-dependent Lon protease